MAQNESDNEHEESYYEKISQSTTTYNSEGRPKIELILMVNLISIVELILTVNLISTVELILTVNLISTVELILTIKLISTVENNFGFNS
ncbi:hypothetical protein C2G38_2153836 [Gigaspora rosea]|uniref:Uncharacterized protein n=1 Tax=Gigaspora rosea TaxID=44941 RepID=A0A397W6Z6_9GLOM|nr:hypothetical protein C2G38_2153836 [Gigaspora rosea]